VTSAVWSFKSIQSIYIYIYIYIYTVELSSGYCMQSLPGAEEVPVLRCIHVRILTLVTIRLKMVYLVPSGRVGDLHMVTIHHVMTFILHDGHILNFLCIKLHWRILFLRVEYSKAFLKRCAAVIIIMCPCRPRGGRH